MGDGVLPLKRNGFAGPWLGSTSTLRYICSQLQNWAQEQGVCFEGANWDPLASVRFIGSLVEENEHAQGSGLSSRALQLRLGNR